MHKLYLAQRPADLNGQTLHALLEQEGLPVCRADAAPFRKKESAWAWHVAALALLENAGHVCSVQKDEHGRPWLQEAAGPFLYLSVSHTQDWAAVCLSDHPCGVDIEAIRPWNEPVARRLCSPAEWQQADALSADERDRFLTAAFVKKEAAGKANGKGLAALLGCDVPEPTALMTFKDLLVCVMELT